MSHSQANEILAKKPKKRLEWVQRRLREEYVTTGECRDLLYEVLTRKEGRAFAADLTGADISRVYLAMQAAIKESVFTVRQQKQLEADSFLLRQLHLKEQNRGKDASAVASGAEASKVANAATSTPPPPSPRRSAVAAPSALGTHASLTEGGSSASSGSKRTASWSDLAQRQQAKAAEVQKVLSASELLQGLHAQRSIMGGSSTTASRPPAGDQSRSPRRTGRPPQATLAERPHGERRGGRRRKAGRSESSSPSEEFAPGSITLASPPRGVPAEEQAEVEERRRRAELEEVEEKSRRIAEAAKAADRKRKAKAAAAMIEGKRRRDQDAAEADDKRRKAAEVAGAPEAAEATGRKKVEAAEQERRRRAEAGEPEQKQKTEAVEAEQRRKAEVAEAEKSRRQEVAEAGSNRERAETLAGEDLGKLVDPSKSKEMRRRTAAAETGEQRIGGEWAESDPVSGETSGSALASEHKAINMARAESKERNDGVTCFESSHQDAEEERMRRRLDSPEAMLAATPATPSQNEEAAAFTRCDGQQRPKVPPSRTPREQANATSIQPVQASLTAQVSVSTPALATPPPTSRAQKHANKKNAGSGGGRPRPKVPPPQYVEKAKERAQVKVAQPSVARQWPQAAGDRRSLGASSRIARAVQPASRGALTLRCSSPAGHLAAIAAASRLFEVVELEDSEPEAPPAPRSSATKAAAWPQNAGRRRPSAQASRSAVAPRPKPGAGGASVGGTVIVDLGADEEAPNKRSRRPAPGPVPRRVSRASGTLVVVDQEDDDARPAPAPAMRLGSVSTRAAATFSSAPAPASASKRPRQLALGARLRRAARRKGALEAVQADPYMVALEPEHSWEEQLQQKTKELLRLRLEKKQQEVQALRNKLKRRRAAVEAVAAAKPPEPAIAPARICGVEYPTAISQLCQVVTLC